MQYPGRIPGQVIEHVLWPFTEPFDIVIDPMAGGGTTLDECKAMTLRYQYFDIAPVRNDIAVAGNSRSDECHLHPPANIKRGNSWSRRYCGLSQFIPIVMQRCRAAKHIE